jgi:hypothetical protein
VLKNLKIVENLCQSSFFTFFKNKICNFLNLVIPNVTLRLAIFAAFDLRSLGRQADLSLGLGLGLDLGLLLGLSLVLCLGLFFGLGLFLGLF